MSEITPEMVAEIATKLYRELPGASAAPAAPVSPSSVVPSLPQGFTPSHDYAPNLATAHAPSQSVSPTTMPQGNASYHDGLANFVRQIQLSGVSESPNNCALAGQPD